MGYNDSVKSCKVQGKPVNNLLWPRKMTIKRLVKIFDLSYERLRQKVNGGKIRVENEASLQLQFAAILKSVGELYEERLDEVFCIELEKAVKLEHGAFGKSQTKKAKVDIFFSHIDVKSGESVGCAVELKFFQKKNHRETNNRYDVFADIHNLENYGFFAKVCFMVVVTDHDHYVAQSEYSSDTADFDFRNGHSYVAGTTATYRTAKPYGDPITLNAGYKFQWQETDGKLHFMKLRVAPRVEP